MPALPVVIEGRASTIPWVPSLLLLISLAVRLWGLEYQSLWWDEGVSIYLSGAGFRAMTIEKSFSVDLHPPGYHLGLALWRGAVGSSVFSDRLLSVFGGVLTIALIYSFTRLVIRFCVDRSASAGSPQSPVAPAGIPRFGGAPAIAAILATLSPIDVFYSQETRMYPFLPVFGLISLMATLWLIRRGRRRDWMIWVMVNLAGWYLYYYLALLTLAESLGLLLVLSGLLDRGSSRLSRSMWLKAHLALAVGFAPWLAVIATRSAGSFLAIAPDATTYQSPIEYSMGIGRSFTLGFTSPPASGFIAGIWLVLAGVGLFVLARRHQTLALIMIVSVLVPVAGAGAILLARPFFYPRFILFVLGPLWTVTAIGMTGISRSSIVRFGLLVLLTVSSGFTLATERSTPRTAYSSADYRVVFTTLAPLVQPGDVFIGGYPWEVGYASAYFWGEAPRTIYLGGARGFDTIGRLSGVVDRLWVITYDPTRKFGSDRLESAASVGRTTLAVDQYGDTRLQLFTGQSGHPSIIGPRIATFDDSITLSSQPSASLLPRRPGESVEVNLFWQVARKPASDDTVFIHLIGPDGKIWGQHDAPPLNGAFPTGSWSVGELVVDRRVVHITEGAPAGRYQIEVGLYEPLSGRRLVVGPMATPDNRVIIGSFDVSKN